MLSANFFSACRRAADLPALAAAGLGDALLAFLIAAGAALLFTLPARTGLLYRFAAALAHAALAVRLRHRVRQLLCLCRRRPLFPRLSDRDPDRVRPLRAAHRHPRAARRGAAFGARRHHDAHFGARRRPRGRRAGRDAEKPHPARDARRLDRGLLHGRAVKPNTVGALAGVGTSFLLYLALYFAYGNALLTELAVLTGAIFRAAVLVYAVLKTVIPRLSGSLMSRSARCRPPWACG